MNSTDSVKRFARILMIGLAIALQWFSAEARAGCGTIVKYQTFKAGTTHAHWDFENKRQASAEIVVVK